MVMLRTLLGAPIHTLSPSRQILLSQWRASPLSSFSPIRSNSWISNLGGGDIQHLTESKKRSLKELSCVRSLQVVAVRSGRSERFCSQQFFGKRRGWDNVLQTRTQCLGTAASSKGLSIRFPVTLEENTTLDDIAQVPNFRVYYRSLD
jgi:hypothetical protein